MLEVSRMVGMLKAQPSQNGEITLTPFKYLRHVAETPIKATH